MTEPEPMSQEALATYLYGQTDALHRYIQKQMPSHLTSMISPEDILQEVWIAASRLRSENRLPPQKELSRWLRRVAQRKLFDAFRAARRVKWSGGQRARAAQDVSDDALLLLRAAKPDSEPESDEAMREAMRALQLAVASLPTEQRMAVLYRMYDNESYATIAERMGRPVPTIRSMVWRAMNELRRKLKQAGVGLDDS